MGDVLSALNVISGASPAVLQSLQTHGSFASALSKLNGSKSKTGAVDRLLQDLRESLPDIEKYLGKDPTAAVGSPPWQQKDRRLTDIQVVTNRDLSQQTRFRAFLAYRSFALEFDAWQRQTKAPSRVNRLAADVSRSRQIKGGQINMFIAANGYPRKETGTAITCGTKILIVERLVGHHGISALLAFQPRNFGRLKYSDLPELGSSLGAAGESEGEHRDNSGLREPKGDNEDARGGLRGITRLAEESSEFLDTCQTIYNATCRDAEGATAGPPRDPESAIREEAVVPTGGEQPIRSHQAGCPPSASLDVPHASSCRQRSTAAASPMDGSPYAGDQAFDRIGQPAMPTTFPASAYGSNTGPQQLQGFGAGSMQSAMNDPSATLHRAAFYPWYNYPGFETAAAATEGRNIGTVCNPWDPHTAF